MTSTVVSAPSVYEQMTTMKIKNDSSTVTTTVDSVLSMYEEVTMMKTKKMTQEVKETARTSESERMWGDNKQEQDHGGDNHTPLLPPLLPHKPSLPALPY